MTISQVPASGADVAHEISAASRVSVAVAHLAGQSGNPNPIEQEAARYAVGVAQVGAAIASAKVNADQAAPHGLEFTV